METNAQMNEFEISIARYRRLAREVTDPLAACLLDVVIRDLEAGHLKAERMAEPASIAPALSFAPAAIERAPTGPRVHPEKMLQDAAPKLSRQAASAGAGFGT